MKLTKDSLQTMIKEELDDYRDKVRHMTQMARKLQGKKIDGWEFDYEQMSGTFAWNKGDISVYVTPWWENEDGLALTVMNTDGELLEVPRENLPFDATGDVSKDVKTYLDGAKEALRKYGRKYTR